MIKFFNCLYYSIINTIKNPIFIIQLIITILSLIFITDVENIIILNTIIYTASLLVPLFTISGLRDTEKYYICFIFLLVQSLLSNVIIIGNKFISYDRNFTTYNNMIYGKICKDDTEAYLFVESLEKKRKKEEQKKTFTKLKQS